MDALKNKRRELLGPASKRKMSLRKHIDGFKQNNECKLEINQITKWVFLGSLCLKPVPQLLLQELDMKVGNVKDCNNENCRQGDRNNKQRSVKRKCLREQPNRIYKKKLNKLKSTTTTTTIVIDDDDNITTTTLNKVEIKDNKNSDETTITNNKQEKEEDPKPELETTQPLEHNTERDTPPLLSPQINNNTDNKTLDALTLEPCLNYDNTFPPEFINHSTIPKAVKATNPLPESDSPPRLTLLKKAVITTTEDSIQINDTIIYPKPQIADLNLAPRGEEALDLRIYSEEPPSQEKHITTLVDNIESSNSQDEISTFDSYTTEELLNMDRSPELILTDSDDDAIDQLMYNIMDIKIENSVFVKQFYEVPQHDEYEFKSDFDENSQDRDEKTNKDKEDLRSKMIKRVPQCKICSQEFSSYIKLKKHKLEHNVEAKPYRCVKCGQAYGDLDQLIAHLRIHKGQRPYECRKCNQGFKTMKALEKHERVHVLRKATTPKRTFRCETCQKEFRKLCDLDRHTRVHTGEKPAVCQICNKGFQQAHNLNKHLLIHTQEKPYQCDICSKSFSRNDVLDRHLLTHCVKKPNTCDICNKSYIRASQLSQHMLRYHQDKS